ncbi:MAG: hypothetical protein Q9160_004515 [Pyrenula sp. 1 TL-2023]
MPSSLPDFLSGRYRQYKADTQRIAAWLASTAERCGYALARSTPDAEVEEGNTLVKTRKQKKKQKQEQVRTNKELTKEDRDFTELANYIVAFDRPPVEVPSNLFSAFGRAIGARKRCASWFQKQAKSDDTVRESNRMHSYFIGVLEKTLVALRPRCAPERLEDPLMKAAQDQSLSSEAPLPIELSNMFSALELEEPSDPMQEMPTAAKAQSERSKSAKQNIALYEVEFEAEILQQEMFFAAYCLFADLNDIRTYIKGLWTEYDEGKVNLITASVTTHTAIELARRNQADFDKSFELEHAMDTSVLVQQLAALVHVYNPGQRLAPTDDANFSMPEVTDFFFMAPLFMLEAYTRVLEDGKLPVFRPETFGKYNARLQWSQLHPRQQFQQDKVLLLEYLPDPTALQHFNVTMPAEDAITETTRQFLKEKTLPIHTLFATQVFLDIHHILGPRATYGFKELQGGAAQIKVTVMKTQKFHEKLKVQNWNSHNDQIV